jgi:ribosome-binding protein aMBF1 (putative translation factor)
MPDYPRSQKELLRQARGDMSQKAFALQLKVDKSCLSRYESGKLGAPVRVIDACLEMIANQLTQASGPQIHKALEHARQTVQLLER